MDDFAGDFDYLNNIRDAQMFQRAPWLKNWNLLNIMMMLNLKTDFGPFTKEEMRSDTFTLTPCEMITMLDRKQSYQKRYNFNILTLLCVYSQLEKNRVLFSKIRWLEVRYTNAPINVFPQRGAAGIPWG